VEQFLQAETLVIGLLLIVSLVAIAVRRVRLPYTVALVVVGLLLTAREPLDFSLTPELILALFVPPLVFEAAFHVSFEALRHNIAGILLLAVPGVLITTMIVGGTLVMGIALPLPLALLFGALIAATDPVAVVAVFKTLRAPHRLSVLIEGESLLNDGTAIVVFNLVLAVALTGQFQLMNGIADFVRVAAGGALIGLALGWLTARVIARIDDYLIETTLTTVLAFGSYLIAERLHVSGVLAVVGAGLIAGNLGPQGMSPSTRIVLFNFWEYVAFLVNSLVFLMIGLQINLPSLAADWQAVAWAIAAVIAARIVVVYGLSWVTGRVTAPVPMAWQHVLTWGGLRGALSLALALSLPTALGPAGGLLKVMTFGVVLFTLLVQATTLGPLMRFLRIAGPPRARTEFELRRARLATLRSAEHHLDKQHREGMISPHVWQLLRAEIDAQAGQLADAVREAYTADPTLEEAELSAARLDLLRTRRGALLVLRRDGVVSDDVADQLTAELDAYLAGNTAPPNGDKPAPAQPASNDAA
jgi:CPA1 family monovalent cation:H+ antiporter